MYIQYIHIHVCVCVYSYLIMYASYLVLLYSTSRPTTVDHSREKCKFRVLDSLRGNLALIETAPPTHEPILPGASHLKTGTP